MRRMMVMRKLTTFHGGDLNTRHVRTISKVGLHINNSAGLPKEIPLRVTGISNEAHGRPILPEHLPSPQDKSHFKSHYHC